MEAAVIHIDKLSTKHSPSLMLRLIICNDKCSIIVGLSSNNYEDSTGTITTVSIDTSWIVGYVHLIISSSINNFRIQPNKNWLAPLQI